MGAVGVVLAVLLISCTGFRHLSVLPPAIEGASFVGTQICNDCHANTTRSFPSSPHARLHFDDAEMPDHVGCEACHGPGSRHVATGGGRQLILSGGKESSTCFRCHPSVNAEFHLPLHHPLPEGKMNCIQCHDPHGKDIMKPSFGLVLSRMNQSCAECHREQSKPVVFAHEALREGCSVCHQPHGSINAKMLTEPDNNLCLKCHAQVANYNFPTFGPMMGASPHGQRLAQGTCWSAGCHTAVHGSNIDPRMRF